MDNRQVTLCAAVSSLVAASGCGADVEKAGRPDLGVAADSSADFDLDAAGSAEMARDAGPDDETPQPPADATAIGWLRYEHQCLERGPVSFGATTEPWGASYISLFDDQARIHPGTLGPRVQDGEVRFECDGPGFPESPERVALAVDPSEGEQLTWQIVRLTCDGSGPFAEVDRSFVAGSVINVDGDTVWLNPAVGHDTRVEPDGTLRMYCEMAGHPWGSQVRVALAYPDLDHEELVWTRHEFTCPEEESTQPVMHVVAEDVDPGLDAVQLIQRLSDYWITRNRVGSWLQINSRRELVVPCGGDDERGFLPGETVRLTLGYHR